MKIFRNLALGAGLALGMLAVNSAAQTDGSVSLNIKLSNYTGKSSSTKHWSVVWVTEADGTFIKTLRRQGPSVTSSHWNSHCRVWWDAKRDTSNGGNDVVDGYTSATTSDYSSMVVPWDCRDASNHLVADGNYRFYVQYAEDSGQGPSTTTAIQWAKGPSASSTNYPSQGAVGSPADGNNFTQLAVTWEPVNVAPSITSTAPPSTGTLGVPYSHSCSCEGTAPITFSATGLPTGLSISNSGVISGIPEEAGHFTGTITASNGAPTDATQAFSINIIAVPVFIASTERLDAGVQLSGSGPADGVYTVLATVNPALPLASWAEITTGSIDGTGQFSITLPIAPAVPEMYFRVRIP